MRTQAADDLIGLSLGHCVVEALLGQGGMARVYRARQQHLDRDVAIKVLPPYYAADPAFVERFKIEARAMARLSHPHIVTVHDAGEEAGRLYIVMEYIKGGNLRERMRASMSLRDITRIVQEVASALTYAHANGIIHRDVKPVNVLMDRLGRAVLSDFGIAKMLASSAALTRSGAGVGTPEYMSPEQCRGGAVDARSDIYALGVMLYEMLTGHTPFEAENYTAIAHAHIYEPVPPPARLNPRISPAVQSVILKALEKDPAERFQQATEMALALEQAVAAQMPVTPQQDRRALSLPVPVAAPQPPPPAIVLCPRCHARNSARQRFCSTCGLPFGMPSLVPPSGYPALTGRLTGAPMIPCHACHAPNNPVNRFCTACGQSLGIPCRFCGMRNAPGQRYCTACGQPLA